jgi:multiple sugar transport system substrate-binding protein
MSKLPKSLTSGFRRRGFVCGSIAALCATLGLAVAQASELTINSMHSDPSAKRAFENVVQGFRAENKEIKVVVNTIDHESYKVQIRTWLPNNPPDVATWFAGNRARFFVEKNLVEPLDDVWKPLEGEFPESIRKSVTFNGKKYLMPATSYHWGFYYRKDLFEKAGITTPPSDWKSFQEAIAKLKAAGIVPIAIGTRQAWPAAAWFDFLNMRVNGFENHMALLSGKSSYTDAKVKKTMSVWAEMVRAQAFPKNAPALTWQEASALLWQGKAGMYLMGNFIANEIPKELAGKVDFFPFPQYDSKIPAGQVAPTDVFFVPAKARNKANAKKFMAYLGRADVQESYNRESVLLPPNSKAKIDESNPFLKKGMQVVKEAAGLSQFFDRDTEPEVAKVGMDGFVEFMAYPDRVDSILQKIEAARVRTSKP